MGTTKMLIYKARSAHNPEAEGSSPSPATKEKPVNTKRLTGFTFYQNESPLAVLGTIWVLFDDFLLIMRSFPRV